MELECEAGVCVAGVYGSGVWGLSARVRGVNACTRVSRRQYTRGSKRASEHASILHASICACRRGIIRAS